MGSFKPFYSWDKRADDALMLLGRFGSLAMTAVAIQQIAETTSLADVQDFVTTSYIDVLDWGIEKITALPGSDKAALPSLDKLSKDHADDNETNASDTVKIDDPKLREGEDDDDHVSEDFSK